jgi:hypothetical protein
MAAGPRRPARRLTRPHRRATYVALGVAAVVAASVAFDVGHGATAGDRAGDHRSLVTTMKADVGACVSSVSDSLEAYRAVAGGQTGERHAAQGIISGDEPNCTPEDNSDLYDLATLEVPGTLRDYKVQPAVTDLVTWAFPDGAAAINDLGRLLVVPADQSARDDLRRRLVTMGQLADAAQGLLDAAGRRLGTQVASLDVGTAKWLGSGTL